MSPYVHQDGCAGSYITEDWVSERCLHLSTHPSVHPTARKSRATGPRRTQCQHAHQHADAERHKIPVTQLVWKQGKSHIQDQNHQWTRPTLTVDKVAGTTVTCCGWSLGSTGWEERIDSWIVLTVKIKEKPYDSINKQSLMETWGGKGLGGEPTF